MDVQYVYWSGQSSIAPLNSIIWVSDIKYNVPLFFPLDLDWAFIKHPNPLELLLCTLKQWKHPLTEHTDALQCTYALYTT